MKSGRWDVGMAIVLIAAAFGLTDTAASDDDHDDHGGNGHCYADGQCADGLVCGRGRRCVPGCRIRGVLHAPGALDPNNPCQACRPRVSTWRWSQLPYGTSCDDDNACTTADACRGDRCLGGGALDCDDRDICTVDSCDPRVGCENARVAEGKTCDMWVTDGAVYAAALHGDTLYLGGQFRWVSPSAPGSFIPLDKASARLRPGFPEVWGEVSGAASDGAGGWYIVGRFERVGEAIRPKLAHIRADGTVSDWNPCANPSDCRESAMHSIAVADGLVYVTLGLHNSVQGEGRWGIAAFDAVTGQLQPWNPHLEPLAPVEWTRVLVSGGIVFISEGTAGSYVPPNVLRPRLVAIDAKTAEVLAVKEADGAVNALVRRGDTLYVGGYFSVIDGAPHSRLAAVDLADWSVKVWNPGITGPSGVDAMVGRWNRLYLAGGFSAIGGVARGGLAAIDAATGALIDWQPDGWNPPDVSPLALAIDGRTLYAGASDVLAIDALTGSVQEWHPGLHRSGVAVLAVDRNAVWAGAGTKLFTAGDGGTAGDGFTMGGVPREFLAAIDVRTGRPTDWNPNADCFLPDGGRLATNIVATDEAVYLGDFRSIPLPNGGTGTQTSVTAMVPAAGTSACIRWTVDLLPNQFVDALALGDGVLYVGGRNIPGGASAVDTSDGSLTSWNPVVQRPNSVGNLINGTVHALEPVGDEIYVGGWFTHSHGIPRNGLVVADPSSGLPTAVDPNPTGGFERNRIGRIKASGGLVYVTGSFTGIGGQQRAGLAAIDPLTGLATAWNPPAAGCFGRDLEIDGGNVYQLGGGLCVADTVTGEAVRWDLFDRSSFPGFDVLYQSDPPPDAFEARDGVLYIGGAYGPVGGRLRSGVAAVAGASSASSSK